MERQKQTKSRTKRENDPNTHSPYPIEGNGAPAKANNHQFEVVPRVVPVLPLVPAHPLELAVGVVDDEEDEDALADHNEEPEALTIAEEFDGVEFDEGVEGAWCREGGGRG